MGMWKNISEYLLMLEFYSAINKNEIFSFMKT